MVPLPGESDNLATGCPLHEVSFITMLSGVMPRSLVRLVPMPKPVWVRPAKWRYSRIAVGMSSPSEKTSRLVLASTRSFA